ncbi:Uu.00g098420.m01.CDS01 [Anthostomella pinea]|uniref:Uu.00g098420.m01.CDS01 n=1 Tax=Anthostomella pinea TaxID=933095 RepID=A0AAI8V7J0_9PEZI|nr:Uu.00g098420.m01.CDS01 [Anthostomella pinea]
MVPNNLPLDAKMVSLLELPVELVKAIVDFVDPADKQTLFNLTLVCTALNSLATPVLYDRVVFDSSHYGNAGTAPVPTFIRSVLSSQYRASLVKSFAITNKVCANAEGAGSLDIFTAI